MKKFIILSTLLFIGLFVIYGCGKKEEKSAKETDIVEKVKPKWTIGMSQCNLGEPWRVQMNLDIKNTSEKYPEIKVIFKDAQNNSLKQRAQIEEYSSAGVDLIIVSPKEAAPLTPPVAAAFDKGIPVIVLDRRVLGDKYTCFIGADNKKIGKSAGEWIVKRLGGKGKLVELKGLMTSICFGSFSKDWPGLCSQRSWSTRRLSGSKGSRSGKRYYFRWHRCSAP
jgi:ribose transport system substrate-binding protein